MALSRATNPDLYALADDVADALGIGVPVELYQAADEGVLNAALFYAPDLARVVLHGAIQDRLPADELRCVLGHELAHHLLWTVDGGTVLHARRLLEGLAAHSLSPALSETLRLFSLTTEVYADRGGLAVTDLPTAIRTLVRMRTGLKDVDADGFLAQSHELLAHQEGSRAWTHPEAHIRALVLERAAADGPTDEAWIRWVIEGPLELDALDMLQREALSELTHRLVAWLVEPPWFQTDTVMGHTRQLLDDAPLPAPSALSPDQVEACGDTVRDYLCAVLVDYVAIDPDLDDMALLRADQVAEALGLQEPFQRSVNRLLKRTRKAISTSLEHRDSRLAAAAEQAGANG